jgi:hypothetical protein
LNLSPANQVGLTVALLVVAVYFTILVGWALVRYRVYRGVAGTDVVTWPRRRRWHDGLLVGLGVASAFVAVLNAVLERPPHHVYSQGIMAVYFLVVVPLSARIRLGFYRDGVWSENGFLAWREIGRLAFREKPEIVLLLLRRGSRARLYRLPVPPDEYGPVRRVLSDMIRTGTVVVDEPLLGLGASPGAPV